MNWVERLNATIAYMEDHIAEQIDYEELAKIACCSSYHYQRMFTYMAGVPLGEYLRRRRMTLAATDLQNGQKVIEVAAKYGYASPTAFNRAFQSIHDISPSQVKNQGNVRAYRPLTFTISIKGTEPMEYRIEEHESIHIVGISSPLSSNIEENFQTVPGMWARAAQEGIIERLMPFMNSDPRGVLGVSITTGADQWKYFIAVASNETEVDGFDEYVIPAATWAIFSGRGDGQAIQELEKQIVTEWLPSSGYEYAGAADIEVYLNPDPTNMVYEVWIPVRKASTI